MWPRQYSEQENISLILVLSIHYVLYKILKKKCKKLVLAKADVKLESIILGCNLALSLIS